MTRQPTPEHGGTSIDRPNRVPQYTLVRLLGSGAFGAVYEALDDKPLRARRAIKILEPLPFPDLEDGRRRFMREAEAIARLAHRSIVPLIGVDFTDDGFPALIMDFVEGDRLSVAASTMSLESRVSAVVEVLLALAHAHSNGVYHRDVKPSNIMVRASDEQIILVDFGAAYVFDGASSNTLTSQAVGSLGYIPPEVLADPKLRRPTHDVYSCAVTLYELLAGRRPNPLEFRSLTEIDPTLGSLDVIIKRAIAAERTRYDSCQIFARDLETWLEIRRLSQGSARSSQTHSLRALLLASKRKGDERRDLDSAQREGLSTAITQAQTFIETAAEVALTELAALLTETHGGECKVEAQSMQPDRTGTTPLFKLHAAAFPHISVVIARSTAFAEPLGRPIPILKWPDAAWLRAQRLPSPPDRYQPPFWIIFDDRGGYRSPSRVLRGGIAAYISRVDSASWTYELGLHAGDGSAAAKVPATLCTSDEIRDFWLARGAEIFASSL